MGLDRDGVYGMGVHSPTSPTYGLRDGEQRASSPAVYGLRGGLSPLGSPDSIYDNDRGDSDAATYGLGGTLRHTTNRRRSSTVRRPSSTTDELYSNRRVPQTKAGQATPPPLLPRQPRRDSQSTTDGTGVENANEQHNQRVLSPVPLEPDHGEDFIDAAHVNTLLRNANHRISVLGGSPKAKVNSKTTKLPTAPPTPSPVQDEAMDGSRKSKFSPERKKKSKKAPPPPPPPTVSPPSQRVLSPYCERVLSPVATHLPGSVQDEV